MVPRTFRERPPLTCLKDLIWPSRARPQLTFWGHPNLTSWGRLEMMSWRRPNLTSKGRPWDVVLGRPEDVLRTSSRRPWKHVSRTMWGHLFDVPEFLLLFYRKLFDWPNLTKSNSILKVYLEPYWTSKIELFQQN